MSNVIQLYEEVAGPWYAWVGDPLTGMPIQLDDGDWALTYRAQMHGPFDTQQEAVDFVFESTKGKGGWPACVYPVETTTGAA